MAVCVGFKAYKNSAEEMPRQSRLVLMIRLSSVVAAQNFADLVANNLADCIAAVA